VNPNVLRQRLALACVIALGAACGEVGAPIGTGSTTPVESSDIGDDQRPDTTKSSTHDFGTQVGSEGIWGCIITSIDEIDGSELVPGTTEASDKMVTRLTSGWALTLDVFGSGTEEGGLWVDTPTRYALVKTDGCGDYVEARTTGLLDRGDASVAVDGRLALSADRAAVNLAAPSLDDDVRAAWGEPSSADLAYLEVDAELDGLDLVGVVRHAECPESTCLGEDLALLVGTR